MGVTSTGPHRPATWALHKRVQLYKSCSDASLCDMVQIGKFGSTGALTFSDMDSVVDGTEFCMYAAHIGTWYKTAPASHVTLALKQLTAIPAASAASAVAAATTVYDVATVPEGIGSVYASEGAPIRFGSGNTVGVSMAGLPTSGIVHLHLVGAIEPVS